MKHQKLLLLSIFSVFVFNLSICQEDAFADSEVSAVTPSEKVAEVAPVEEEISIDFDLPIIGTVKLYPFEEEVEGKKVSGFKVYVPSKGSELDWGPINIKEGTLKLIDEKPQYSARATVFGESAILKLKEISGEQKIGSETKYAFVRFGVDFDKGKEPTIELIPGKKAILQTVDIVLEKTKPVQIIAKTDILNQPITITFSYENGQTDAWAQIKKVPLKNIISAVENTPLDQAELENFTVLIKNFTSKSKQPSQLIIEGKADLSKTPGLADSKDAKEVNLTINATQKEQKIQAVIKQLIVPGLGTIQDAKLIGEFTDEKKEVTLTGISTITFAGVGTFQMLVEAQVSKKGMEFSGKVQQTIKFADINIKNAELRFSTENKTVSLIGIGNVKGYQAEIEIIKDAKDMISARAKLAEKELRPFQDIPIAHVRDITIKDPGFKFISKGQEFEIVMEGIAVIFGVPMQSNLYLKKTPQGQTTLLEVAAPKNWKLSQGMPELKGTIFDQIELEDLYFIISSDDYKDAARQTTFKKGFNILSKTKLTGALVPVGTLTHTSPESVITIQGYLAPNPLDSVFKAMIPNGIVMKQDSVTVGKVELEIAGNPAPKFALLTTMIIKPSPQDDPLTFTTRISFSTVPPSASFAGTMQGVWKNPLGISGFAIGTDYPTVPVKGIAAEIAVNLSPGAFPNTGLPESIGLAGSLMINPDRKITMTDEHGNKIEVPLFVAMAIKLPVAGSADLVLYGELSQLTLEDLAVLAKNVVGNPLKIGNMPEVGMRNSKVYIVPKATTIGEFIFDRGFTLRGEIFFPGFKAFGNFTISSDGIIAQAMCSEIKWGPLLVTRSKFETAQTKERAETRDPKLAEFTGPVASLKLTLKDQHIYISGMIRIADLVEDDTFFTMDSSGIEFDFQTTIGKAMYKEPQTGKDVALLDSHIHGKSSGSLSDPQFYLSIDLEDNFQAYLLTQVKEKIKNAKLQVTKDIGKAILEVEKTKEIDPAEVARRIKKAQEEVQAAKQKLAAIDSAIKEAEDKIGQPQAQVRSLQNQIDDMNRRIQNSKDYCNNAEWYRKVDKCVQSGAEITGYGTALAGIYVAKETADKVLEAAKQSATGFLKLSRAAAEKTLDTSKAFLEKVGKPIATTGALAVRETAKGVLIGGREVAWGVLSASEDTAQFLLTAIDIQKKHWDGNLQDFASGRMGNLRVSGKIFNQNFTVSANLDIRKPFDAIGDLANEIVKTFENIFNKVKDKEVQVVPTPEIKKVEEKKIEKELKEKVEKELREKEAMSIKSSTPAPTDQTKQVPTIDAPQEPGEAPEQFFESEMEYQEAHNEFNFNDNLIVWTLTKRAWGV